MILTLAGMKTYIVDLLPFIKAVPIQIVLRWRCANTPSDEKNALLNIHQPWDCYMDQVLTLRSTLAAFCLVLFWYCSILFDSQRNLTNTLCAQFDFGHLTRIIIAST